MEIQLKNKHKLQELMEKCMEYQSKIFDVWLWYSGHVNELELRVQLGGSEFDCDEGAKNVEFYTNIEGNLESDFADVEDAIKWLEERFAENEEFIGKILDLRLEKDKKILAKLVKKYGNLDKLGE